jgi:hypothetical protein
MPTRYKGYYLIMRARTSINWLSLALTVEFSIRRSPNNYPRYPNGRLSMVKHRQLAPGRGFRWICIRELDRPRQHDLLDGINLHLRIMDLRGEQRWQAPRPSQRFSSPWRRRYFDDCDRSTHQKIHMAHDVWSDSDFMANQVWLKLRLYIRDGVLSGFFLWWTEFFPARTPQHGLSPSRIQLGILSEFLKKPGPFPFGLHNMATSYQALLQGSTNLVRRLLLTGAQEGLVLTIMSQDYIVHWPGSIPEDDSTQLVGMTMVLPY